MDTPTHLSDHQARKWRHALQHMTQAQLTMGEAALTHLEPRSAASALRDASHEARRAAIALEDLAQTFERAA